jgi:hypothetical protein
LVFAVATYWGAVRVKAGRSERVEVVAARASGLKVLAMEVMAKLYSREGGVLKTKLHAQYKRQKEDGLVVACFSRGSRMRCPVASRTKLNLG